MPGSARPIADPGAVWPNAGLNPVFGETCGVTEGEAGAAGYAYDWPDVLGANWLVCVLVLCEGGEACPGPISPGNGWMPKSEACGSVDVAPFAGRPGAEFAGADRDGTGCSDVRRRSYRIRGRLTERRIRRGLVFYRQGNRGAQRRAILLSRIAPAIRWRLRSWRSECHLAGPDFPKLDSTDRDSTGRNSTCGE